MNTKSRGLSPRVGRTFSRIPPHDSEPGLADAKSKTYWNTFAKQVAFRGIFSRCQLRALVVGRMLDLIRRLRAGSLIWTIEDQRRIVNLNILKAKLKGGRVDDCGELL